jgi:hypothetical protein
LDVVTPGSPPRKQRAELSKAAAKRPLEGSCVSYGGCLVLFFDQGPRELFVEGEIVRFILDWGRGRKDVINIECKEEGTRREKDDRVVRRLTILMNLV